MEPDPAAPRVLLVVHHTASPSLQSLLDAVLDGTHAEAITGVEVRVRPALATTAVDLLPADGLILGTPANIGYMSGAMKHFFDEIYYPTLMAKIGLPFGFYVHGNSDTAGAVRAITSIAKGLGWRQAYEPVVVLGQPDKLEREACWDLGATIAARVIAES